MTYTIESMIVMAISAGLFGSLTAGLIVDAWHRRQQPRPARAAEPPAETRAALHAATDAIAQMRRSAHAYKELAETLEASLAKARADLATAEEEAARQEERATAAQFMYAQRTAEALKAGCTIVFDHGNPRRHQREE